ncbi:hypothetical protein ABH926_008578 [Catenulispora sp. GP43]|uniref:hypothetical protein n=1 Tax=Catenulispora sp. GP43 TaxID=3156263 RepID=UPI003513E6C0
MASVWGKFEDQQRVQWDCDPLDRIGPVAFGMRHQEVSAAVGAHFDEKPIALTPEGAVIYSEFAIKDARFLAPSSAMTAYYDTSERLYCVAINARYGPQVSLDGLRLVGRIPSEVEDEFTSYLEERSLRLVFSQFWDPSAPEIGLVIRAQRVDDVVLSRPVFVSREYSEGCGDVASERIPPEEWRRYS